MSEAQCFVNLCSRGLKGRTTKAKSLGDKYFLPIPVVSKDDDSPDMRIGRLSYCLAPKARNGQWTGVTVRTIFSKTWIGTTAFDHRENVIGKTVYEGRWMSDVRKDVTRDPSEMKLLRPVGKVVKVDATRAEILLDKNFTDDASFASDGYWLEDSLTREQKVELLKNSRCLCQPLVDDGRMTCGFHTPRRIDRGSRYRSAVMAVF